MFDKLGHSLPKHPLAFIFAWVVLVVVAGVAALTGFGHGGIFDRLANTESMVTGTESDEVSNLTSTTDGGESLSVVVKGVDMQTDAMQLATWLPSEREAFADVDGVESVVDPFVIGDLTNETAQAMMSANGDGFIIAITLNEDLTDDEIDAAQDALVTATDAFKTNLAAEFPDATANLMSADLLHDGLTGQVADDLVIGESIGLPVALILMIIVFGGILAAGLPLISAVISIVVGMGAMWILTFSIGVDSFILNVIAVIGMALSIDYGLLVVSRMREEASKALAARGFAPDGSDITDPKVADEIAKEALTTTIATAGRTVSFSALTIACSIAGLLLMQSDILKTVAIGAISVALLAVISAVTFVPALIALLGHRFIRPSLLSKIPGVRSLSKAFGDTSTDHGFFSKLAERVHQHPWIVMIGVLAILAVFAAPLRNLHVRTSMNEYLPQDEPATIAFQTIQDDYPALRNPTITIVADAPVAETGELYTHLSGLDHVTSVVPTALSGDDSRTVLKVNMDVDDEIGEEVTNTVTDLRDYDPGYEIKVGGSAALQHDFLQSIFDDAPKVLAVIILSVLILLFLMTGSVIVPLKALLINSISLLSSLGLASWIFENGHLGMPTLLGLETIIVVLVLSFGFGLAMDYEVFLLTRIKEYWDAGLDNDTAVERGLQRSGRIITSAAAIIIAVFIGFSFGEMVAIKQVGVTLALTVAIDATLVRMLLVPATMTILGKWNWWAPKPLRILYEKFRIVH